MPSPNFLGRGQVHDRGFFNADMLQAIRQVGNTKSFAQVESLVLPPNSGALKRGGIPGGVTNGITISGVKCISGQKPQFDAH